MSERTDLKIGIIGCGGHASISIYPSLRNAPVELVAVCDLDEAKAAYTARKFGAKRYYLDALEMMDKEELEAVFVIGPAPVHYKLAKEALRRGLHVWMEKPPGISAAQAYELLQLSRQYDRQVQVGFMMRFVPSHKMARQIAERPEFGGAKAIYYRYMAEAYPDDTTFYLYHCVHGTDFVQYMMGPAEKVFSRISRAGEGRFHLQASISFAGGKIGTLDMSSLQDWASPNVFLEITGAGRHVTVDNSAELTYYRGAPIRPTVRPDRHFFVEETESLDDGKDALTWKPNQNWASVYSYRGYEDELNHFASSILAGQPVGPNIEQGYEAMKLLEAMRLSVETGREVALTEVEAAVKAEAAQG